MSYIGSRVAAVLVYGSRQRFSTSADPSQGGTFEENFARWLAFTVRTFAAKRRRAVKSLVCSRRGTKYHSGDFCGRSRRRELSPPLNTVGTLLLLLMVVLVLLLCGANDRFPTKNFVALRSNVVGTTAGERRLIPGKV